MAIYLDHNATTPLDPRVLDAMLPFLQAAYGNPSSVYRAGRYARGAIDRARDQIAALVGAHPSQVIFTGGGTEANNFALKGAAAFLQRRRLLVSSIEHASLLGPAHALERQGWQLDCVAVDQSGRVSADNLRELLQASEVGLVSVMRANNETGVMQDVATLAATARERGALVHTDATQAAGKMALDFGALNVHLMTLSAHKMYGPKGVGALIIDKSLELEPLLHGGGQERDLRGGTENVAAIVGFGVAAELAAAELSERAAHVRRLRDRLELVLTAMPQLPIFGLEAERLPNTVYFGVPGIDGETLLMQFDRAGIAVSSGSACDSGTTDPSHVLVAMGVKKDIGRSAIRVSFGMQNTDNDVDLFMAGLGQILSRLSG